MLFVAFLFFTIKTDAQTKTQPSLKRYLFHSHGISFQKFSNLNSRIKAYPQYEQLKNTTGTLHFGFFTEYDKFIVGYSANFGSSLSGDKNKKSSSTRFLGGSIDVGYNLIKTSRVSLFPYVGLGYEQFTASFNRDISSVAFDSVLATNNARKNTEQLVFTNAFALYRVGISTFVTSRKRPQSSLGLQVGYTGSFGEKDWKINNTQTLLNSPKDKLSKVSASILIRYELKNRNKIN